MTAKRIDRLVYQPLMSPAVIIAKLNELIDGYNQLIGAVVGTSSSTKAFDLAQSEPTITVTAAPKDLVQANEWLRNPSAVPTASINVSDIYKHPEAIFTPSDDQKADPVFMALLYGVEFIGVVSRFDSPVKCFRSIGTRKCGFPSQSLQDRMLAPVAQCLGCIDGMKNG